MTPLTKLIYTFIIFLYFTFLAYKELGFFRPKFTYNFYRPMILTSSILPMTYSGY